MRASALLALALLAACTGASAERATSEPNLPSTVAPSGVEEGPPSSSPEATPAPLPARFEGTIERLPADVHVEMHGTTWHVGCPVPMRDLRLLTFRYWGFDRVVHEGPMVVNETVAGDVLWVFHQLFDAKYPIKHVALAKRYKPRHDDPDTKRDVTAAFNCRPVITTGGPQPIVSQHAYGWAIDINPLQNPEVAPNGYVRGKYARPYRDRSRGLPGMIHPGDVVVRSFAAIGWEWGGDWSSMKDYMHFSLTGR